MAEDKNLNLSNLVKYNEKIKEYISSHGGASEFKLVFLTKKAYDDLTEEEKMSDVNIYYIIDENGDFTNHVFLTQAAYNALGDKVLTDDVEYYITDAGSEEDLDELKQEVNTLSADISKRLSFPNMDDVLFSGVGTYVATKDYFVVALGFSGENAEYPTTVNGKKVSVSNYTQNLRITATNWFGKKGDSIVTTTAIATVYGLD